VGPLQPITPTDHIEARFGHSKDRRPDLKQVQAGLAVSADGAVPLWHHAYDGTTGEVAQVVPAMEALSSLAGERSFLLVGDSKLVSYPNLAATLAARVGFIAPASRPKTSEGLTDPRSRDRRDVPGGPPEAELGS